jgi:hypothetical protein
MSKKVSLPEGFHDLGEVVDNTPKSTMDGVEISIEKEDEKDDEEMAYYPTLYFRGKEKLKGLPKSGTATIHFKKVMERNETVEVDGKTTKSYCVELEIHGIKPEGSSEEIKTEEEMSSEDAIDAGLDAANEDSETED